MNYQRNEETYPIRLDSLPDGTYHAVIGTKTIKLRAQSLGDDAVLLEFNGKRYLVYTAAAGDRRYVHVDGRILSFTSTTGKSARRISSATGGDLTAQMPGQVMNVLVNMGDRVTRGQTLIILEAMKMEIRITAPQDGMVKSVFIRQGNIVERGQRLIEIG